MVANGGDRDMSCFLLLLLLLFCSIFLSFDWGFDLCGVRILDDDG